MSRSRAPGVMPDLQAIKSAMSSALPHFSVNPEDIDRMARAVKRLYDQRLKERGVE